ncbi:MAG: hypothetical protein HRT45_09755 [Bdellovibrionales bacterium]|nr:hypothetical protein [Bdellovibrionales bacterium]
MSSAKNGQSDRDQPTFEGLAGNLKPWGAPLIYVVICYVITKLWLVALVVYGVFTNQTNHTGLPFWGISVAVTVGSIGNLFFLKSQFAKWTLVWLVLLWVVIILFDHCQILLPYEDWLKQGMPVEKGVCWQ